MALNFKKNDMEFLLSVADVMLLQVVEKEEGQKETIQLASATLKSHSMNQTVDTTEIRAGQANDVLATIKNNKTIEVTIEDVQQKHDFIAMMLGSSIEDNAKTVDAYVMPQGLEVGKTVGGKGGEGQIVLPQKPKAGEVLEVRTVDGKELTPQIGEDNVVSLTGETLKDGDIVYISGYAYAAPTDNMKISIKSDKFAGSYKMVLDEQVFNADMQVIARKQTVFHKVIPNDSFTLDGSAERAEKTASYTFTVALEPGQKELGYVLYIPEA